MVRFPSFRYDHGKDSVLLVPGQSSVISFYLRNPMNLDSLRTQEARRCGLKPYQLYLLQLSGRG